MFTHWQVGLDNLWKKCKQYILYLLRFRLRAIILGKDGDSELLRMCVKEQLMFSLCEWVKEGCCIRDLVLWERRNVLYSFTIHTTVCSGLKSLILNTDFVSVLNSW